MILYENLDFCSNIDKVSDYVFTAVENFMHDWSLRAQRHIPHVGMTHKKLVAESNSLDELNVWLDVHIPDAKILWVQSYDDLIKMSKISSCGSIERKTS